MTDVPARARVSSRVRPIRAALLLLSFPICLIPASGGAAPAESPPLSLSLQDAETRAESASGLVLRARAETKTVAARSVGADLLFPANPVVAAAAGPRHEDSAGTRVSGTAFSAHVEQAIEVAGQRSTRQREVARAVDSARLREEVAQAEIRARVRAAYKGAQLAEAQIRSARQRVALTEQLVGGVETRVRTGAASQVDLDLARVELGRATRELQTSELASGLALSPLRVLIGVEPGMPLELTTPIDRPTPPPELGVLIARARTLRAELKALGASQQAADATLVRLRREAIPSPTLFLDLQRDLPGQLYLGGGVAVPLPLWRRNQGERAVVRAERERLEVETRAVEREIDSEVERAHHALSIQLRILAGLEKDVLPAAESAVVLTTEGWRAGKFDLFRVIQASREASEARRSQLESLGSLWDAAIA
ncbi:MAG TPA: TolC family protein, partial [Polyangia bacterium]|nr:TolC family protein [Polyangia bacterium]